MAERAATADARLIEVGVTARREVAELEKTISAARSRSTELVDRLRSQASNLEEVAGRALATSGLATRDFERQASQLVAASEQAEAQAERLSKEALSRRQTDFVALLANITSSLTALGIDLTRAYERDLPDDAWKRYLDGDRPVFVRRLLQRREMHSLNAIRDKYRDSRDFREQVSLYLEKFETLLEAAQKYDREKLVSAAYLSSDVGKLYLLLARALDRVK